MGWPENTPMLFILANPLMEPYINDDSDVKEEYDAALEEVYGTDTDALAQGKAEVGYVEEFNTDKKAIYEKYKNVAVEEISGPSRLYTYDPETVAQKIRDFVQGLDK